jgi:hypothetical protein
MEQGLTDEEVLQTHWNAAHVYGQGKSYNNVEKNIFRERKMAIQAIHIARA